MAKAPKGNDDQEFSDEEIARRRDAIVKRMLNTPPQPKRNAKTSTKKAARAPRRA